MSDQIRKILIRFLGLAIFAALILHFDTTAIFSQLAEADLSLILAAFACSLIVAALKALRWQRLVVHAGMTLSPWLAYRLFWAGVMFGSVTPGRLGDFYRAWPVGRMNNRPVADIFPSLLVDRMFDTIFLLLALVVLIPSIESSGVVTSGQMALVIATLAVGALAFVFILAGVGEALLPKKIKSNANYLAVRDGLRRYDKPVLGVGALLTLAAYTLFAGLGILVARSLGIEIPAISIICALFLGSVAAILPISFSGLGTRDAAIVAIFAAVGVNGEAALSFSILLFLILNVTGAFIGAIFWLKDAKLLSGATKQD